MYLHRKNQFTTQDLEYVLITIIVLFLLFMLYRFYRLRKYGKIAEEGIGASSSEGDTYVVKRIEDKIYVLKNSKIIRIYDASRIEVEAEAAGITIDDTASEQEERFLTKIASREGTEGTYVIKDNVFYYTESGIEYQTDVSNVTEKFFSSLGPESPETFLKTIQDYYGITGDLLVN